MAVTITDPDKLETARAYVVCYDSYMSGHGQAEGKENWLILPCKSIKEAGHVSKYANSRSEIKRVTVMTLAGVAYEMGKHPEHLWQTMDRHNAQYWYSHGGKA